MYAELQVVVEQVHAVLGVVEDRPQQHHYPQQQQQQQAPQTAALAPDLAATLEQLRQATARNSKEEAAALQRQLAAALAAADAAEPGGAAGQRGAGHQAAFEVHQFAELRLQHLKVGAWGVGSVGAPVPACLHVKRV